MIKLKDFIKVIGCYEIEVNVYDSFEDYKNGDYTSVFAGSVYRMNGRIAELVAQYGNDYVFNTNSDFDVIEINVIRKEVI